ncbi:MAG: hypothetical protein AB1665_00155 [Candidatus Thermoplasmatota archaeon]
MNGSDRGYQDSTTLTTRRGGIFWGIVLVIVGTIWLLGALGYVDVKMEIVLPLLVIILGVWLLVTKLAR